MKFKADEIVSVLQKEIEGYREKIDAREVGRVLEIGDGIARVYGLSGVMAGEMVEFTETKVDAIAFNLEENSVSVIILGEYQHISEGDEVRSLGTLLQVPVGEALIGRVVDPLGNPLDGKGPVVTDKFRPVEFHAPGVAERQPVNQPLQTGIKAIDAMTPVGRGQRELIIGDRKTGKTAIAIDTIINQNDQNVICVYVAIGQKESTVAKIVESASRCRRDGLHRSSSPHRPRPRPHCNTIAPYAGCADGRVFHVRAGQGHALRLRRSFQAGRRLSPVVAAGAASAGPRSLSRRYLLRPLALARTLGQDGRTLGHRAERRRREKGDRRLGRQQRKGRETATRRKGQVYVGPLDKEHAEKHDLPKFPGPSWHESRTPAAR